MRTPLLVAFALLSVLSSTPASAVVVQCGSATDYASLDTTIASTCGGSGNGNNLNGINDPVNGLDYLTLDITTTAGLVPLTISTGGTSGSFSFGPTTGYDSFVLGLQTTNSAPNPDWFYLLLADSITSGSWLISGAGAVLTRAVLYGKIAQVDVHVSAAPIPGAFFLFGSVIAGYFGFGRLRKRFAANRLATA